MPPAVRGSVYWYDYGPVIGNELSGSRPALIISNTELNRRLSIAVAIPMSSATPSSRHIQNHVFVEAANSWASVRQIKAIEQRRLGAKITDAAPHDLERILEILVARLDSRRNRPGTIQTPSGDEQIGPGTIWEVEFHAPDGSVLPTQMLVLDYNDGNKMAIAVEVEHRLSPDSPVRIPINMIGGTQPASALVHRVRSIDVEARTVIKTGVADEASLVSVGQALLSLVDR